MEQNITLRSTNTPLVPHRETDPWSTYVLLTTQEMPPTRTQTCFSHIRPSWHVVQKSATPLFLCMFFHRRRDSRARQRTDAGLTALPWGGKSSALENQAAMGSGSEGSRAPGEGFGGSEVQGK